MLVKILVILWQGGLVVINSFYEFSFGCEIRTLHCKIFCLGLFNRDWSGD